MKILTRWWWLAAAAAVVAAASAVLATGAFAAQNTTPSRAGGLGPTSGLLPRDHLTLESAIQVNLSKETVRLPLYPGTAHGQRVWFVLLDASDAGLAHDLGVNYAPKLANIAISDPAAVQTVTLSSPTPAQNPFGPAVVHFAGAPDFSPTRIAHPGPTGFPLAKFAPGAVAGPGYSPFIRIAGSNVVYDAPIVATGNGPFDVVHHTNTGDRVLGIHIAGKSKPGQFAESWADLLFVKGFDAGQPIVYISTDAGQPLTAVLERSTYVPALNNAAFKGVNTLLSGSLRAEERARQPEHHPVGTPVGEVQVRVVLTPRPAGRAAGHHAHPTGPTRSACTGPRSSPSRAWRSWPAHAGRGGQLHPMIGRAKRRRLSSFTPVVHECRHRSDRPDLHAGSADISLCLGSLSLAWRPGRRVAVREVCGRAGCGS